ncbi:MAG: hypothetical protein WDZ93_03640 [Candidatus Paceibacterota bacterium]
MNIDFGRLKSLCREMEEDKEGFNFQRSEELAHALGLHISTSYADPQMTTRYAHEGGHRLELPFHGMSVSYGFPRLLSFCHETLSYIFGDKGHSVQFFETVRSPGNGSWVDRPVSEHVCSISVTGSIFSPERTVQSPAYVDALLQYGKPNALLHAFVGVLEHDSVQNFMRRAA